MGIKRHRPEEIVTKLDPYRFSGECLLLEFEINRRKEWVSEEHRNLELRLCAWH